jgi:hypothetical protein
VAKPAPVEAKPAPAVAKPAPAEPKPSPAVVKPARAGFMVSQPLVEFSDAGLKEDALRAMARLTKGRYYSLQEAGELPAQIEKAVRDVREEESLHEDK